MLDLNRALSVALDADDYVDIFEAGTPLIDYNGIKAVRRLKHRFGTKPVAADLKIADAAEIEVSMARDAGATLVTVLASAPPETIRLSVQQAHACGLRIIVDLLGMADEEIKLPELETLGVDFVLVHVGIDQPRHCARPLEKLKQLAQATPLTLGVAGELNVGDIPPIRDIPNLGLVVVGEAITSASNPGHAARKFREALNR